MLLARGGSPHAVNTLTLVTVPPFLEGVNPPERGVRPFAAAPMEWILPGSDHLLFSFCRGSSRRTRGKRQTTAATAPALETLPRRSTM